MKSVVRRMTNAQRDELRSAIESIKTCDYRGTAIKVELEANLNRDYYDDDDSYCEECNGEGYRYCEECEEEGYNRCPDECDYGVIYNADLEEDEECTADGCENGWVRCENHCEDGTVTCSYCDGSGRGEPDEDSENWTNERCKQFILNHVPQAAKEALIFSMFYVDGSVDSEFTFTLPIDNAHMVVYFIEAFNALAEAIGHGCTTARAGMHTAILNSRNGSYPAGNSLNDRKIQNFANALEPLMPALYFLASSDRNARSLGYRGPRVGEGKNCAVNYYHGCFEYRIFETCYQRPLAFIDNIIVIANTLRYYKDTPTNTSMKIGELGLKDGEGLERFYYTIKHVEALERGLRVLKPKYKSIDQLKSERNLDISLSKFRERERKLRQEWRKEFEEVKKRRKFERLRLYHKGLAEAYAERSYGNEIDVQKYAREYRKRWVQDRSNNLKGTCREYVRDKAKKLQSENVNATIKA